MLYKKYCLNHSHHTDIVPTNAVISDVRLFLDDHRNGDLQHVQCTLTVHDMELLDENPDCVETMPMVAEDLIARFDGVQDGWVVLVGDGKTYKHLMNVKKQYSTILRKVSGDWHILKNYQPILILLV